MKSHACVCIFPFYVFVNTILLCSIPNLSEDGGKNSKGKLNKNFSVEYNPKIALSTFEMYKMQDFS